MNKDVINFDMPKNQSSIIKVLGVGGGGSNAVNYMFKQGIRDVDFIICNTDAQSLDRSPVPNKIQLGASLTEGRGAGSIPNVGENAAIENIEEVKEILSKGTQMLFITAGLGGGTGTGAAPVIAKEAKEMGILTVGIVTLPFAFEGRKRKMQAEEGLKKLRNNVDTLLIICNDKLRDLYGNSTFTDAFSKADNVLSTAAKGIAEIITISGYINVDFADVKTVMQNSGVAIMGSGQAEGENRALKAIQMAISSPLLNDNDIKGASNILLNIKSGTEEITLDEVTEISDYVQKAAGKGADIIWGNGTEEDLGGKVAVTVVATGFSPNEDLGYDALMEERKEEVKNVLPLEEDKELEEPFLQDNADGMKLIIKPEGIRDKSAGKQVKLVSFLGDKLEKEGSHVEQKEISVKSTAKTTQKNDFDENNPDNVFPNKEQNSKERIKRLKEMSAKIKSTKDLNDIENIPAYARKDIKLEEIPLSSESEISRYSLNEDTKKNEIKLKSDNSYLHDNVD